MKNGMVWKRDKSKVWAHGLVLIIRKREKNPIADCLAFNVRALTRKHDLGSFFAGGSWRQNGQFHMHATEMHTFADRYSIY